MSRKPGKFPPWRKSGTSAVSPNDHLAEEENIGLNENQKLVDEIKKLLPEARNRDVSYHIARLVGEQIHLSTSACSLNEWKLFASALGFDNNYALKKAEYWAPRAQEYPLTKLLLEDFKQRQGNLGDLIEVLISKELYAILKAIKPLVQDCIQKNPHDDAYESPSENLKFHTKDGVITINSNHWTVEISSNCTSSTSNDCSSLMSDTTAESSTSTSSASCNITDNCQNGMVKLENSKPSVCVPNKENLTFQTFSCSPESNASFPYQNFPQSLAATNSINSFNGNVPFSSISASPEELSLKEFFSGLSLTPGVESATESMTSTSSVPSFLSTMTKGNAPNHVPLPVDRCSFTRPIYIFITHTMADAQLANTVARRLREDFEAIAVTQLQLLHWFVVNHGDAVSRILRKVHYVMPVVTSQYLDEISVPESVEDSSHPQLSVRNIFTALQAEYFNNSSLNWKIRPVVEKKALLHQTREKQELRIAMRLWEDWELVGLMLRNTVENY